MEAYTMPNAAAGRHGRVEAPARAWRHFERLVVDGPARRLWGGGASSLLVDAEGTRVGVVHGDFMIVVEPFGARVLDGGPGWSAMMGTDGVVYGDRLHPWGAGSHRSLDGSGVFTNEVEQHAARWVDGTWSSVVVAAPARRARRLVATGRADGRAWHRGWPTEGSAAIDDAGGIACAPGGDHIVRLDAAGQTISERALPAGITVRELAAVDGILLATDRDRRRVHVLTADGTLQASVELRVVVHGPALAGPPGRLYAAGQGLVAVDDERVSWSKPANVRLHATSLGTAGVLVAGGTRLCHYDLDGALRSDVRIPDGSRIVAPAAPACDGTLYLSTATGVFALR